MARPPCLLNLEAKAGSPAAKMLGPLLASALWTWPFRMFWGEKVPGVSALNPGRGRFGAQREMEGRDRASV